MNYFDRLKTKWGVKSNKQFILINVIFAISGTSVVFVKRIIFAFLGINELSVWLKIPLYIIIVTPVYFVILFIYGYIFGQSKFFIPFIKIFWKRLLFKSKS